jgi:signal transduction histidine kinase
VFLTPHGEPEWSWRVITGSRYPGYARPMTTAAAPWRADRGLARDGMLAAALLVPVEIFAAAGGQASPVSLSVRLLLDAAPVIPLAWRREAPLTVWAVTGAATAAAFTLGHAAGLVVAPAPLIALYTVTAYRERIVSLAAALATLAGLMINAADGGFVLMVRDVHSGTWLIPIDFAFPAVLVACCWLIGDNVRISRAYVAELRDKAARAESDRAAELATTAAEERARIARELHDSIVHHVSVIAVQAGAARMVAGNGTATTADAGKSWAAVETAARQALTELRQILGLLRHSAQAPALAPRPGLDQLPRLLDQARQAGLPAELRVDGEPVPLGSAADLAAYRIVQEALTNVRKHQGQAATVVTARYRPGELVIEVISQPAPGPPPPLPAGRGHGIIGMRERVAVLGGSLDAGPRPDGGFTVLARIPLRDIPA